MVEALAFREVTEADRIANRRVAEVRCNCERSRCAVLLSHVQAGRDQFERLYCVSEGRPFVRIWIGGYR